MAPTILLDEAGRPFLALSAPGGLMIWPALVQVIQNYIDYEMELEEALNAPRICARTDFSTMTPTSTKLYGWTWN